MTKRKRTERQTTCTENSRSNNTNPTKINICSHTKTLSTKSCIGTKVTSIFKDLTVIQVLATFDEKYLQVLYY
jgi:hypothetical protein